MRIGRCEDADGIPEGFIHDHRPIAFLDELWGHDGGLTPSPLGEDDDVHLVVEGLGRMRDRVGPPVSAPPIAAAHPGDRRRTRGVQR